MANTKERLIKYSSKKLRTIVEQIVAFITSVNSDTLSHHTEVLLNRDRQVGSSSSPTRPCIDKKPVLPKW